MPKVSIILPVYNSEKYVVEAIHSLLSQTFCDFSLHIINDCSSDNTLNLISSFQDKRISITNYTSNQGLVSIFEKSYLLLDCEYICRMDADDIAHPHRISQQCDVLDNNIRIGILGSWFEKIDHYGKTLGISKPPTSHSSILRLLALGENPLCHPSLLARHSLFSNQLLSYDDHFPHAEDFDLYLQLLASSFELANYPRFC